MSVLPSLRLVHVAFLVVLSISCVESDCQWRFYRCRFARIRYANGDLIPLYKECVMDLRWNCSSRIKEERNEDEVAKYCSIRACNVIPAWCSWGAWTKKSDHECGYASGVLERVRRKHCHPVTLVPLTTIVREPTRPQVDTMRGPWTSCDDDDEDSSSSIYPYVWGIAIASCIAILIVSIIGFLCCRRRRRSRPRCRQNRPQRQAPPRAPVSTRQGDPRRYPQESSTTELTRPSAPPAPAFAQDHLPPSYTLCARTSGNTLPPQYEDALKLVT